MGEGSEKGAWARSRGQRPGAGGGGGVGPAWEAPSSRPLAGARAVDLVPRGASPVGVAPSSLFSPASPRGRAARREAWEPAPSPFPRP